MAKAPAVSQLIVEWADLYGYTPVSAMVTYLHLAGILVWGGVAVAAAHYGARVRRAVAAVLAAVVMLACSDRPTDSHSSNCRSRSLRRAPVSIITRCLARG